LKSGDILFCCGDAIFSKVVKAVTKAAISHVGLLYFEDGSSDLMMIHSMDFVGVAPLPLQAYAETYDHGYGYNGMLVVGRHARLEGLPEERVREMISFALSNVGRPYNKDAVYVRAIQEVVESLEPTLLNYPTLGVLAANVARIALRMPLQFDSEAMAQLKNELSRRVIEAVNNDALACSELVDRCFRAIEISFSRSLQEVIPAPSHIAEDPNIRVVCRVLTRRASFVAGLRSLLHQ